MTTPKELDPLHDLARTLGEQVDLPTRTHGDRCPVGGSASIGAKDTLGAVDLCWCGRPSGHDYVGAEDGSPHPRYPA